MYIGLYVKYRDLVRAELFHADGRTDMSYLIVDFRNANAPINARLQGKQVQLKKFIERLVHKRIET